MSRTTAQRVTGYHPFPCRSFPETAGRAPRALVSLSRAYGEPLGDGRAGEAGDDDLTGASAGLRTTAWADGGMKCAQAKGAGRKAEFRRRDLRLSLNAARLLLVFGFFKRKRSAPARSVSAVGAGTPRVSGRKWNQARRKGRLLPCRN